MTEENIAQARTPILYIMVSTAVVSHHSSAWSVKYDKGQLSSGQMAQHNKSYSGKDAVGIVLCQMTIHC